MNIEWNKLDSRIVQAQNLCKLDSLTNRRTKTDLTMTYKILNHNTHLSPKKHFTLAKKYKRRTLYLQTQTHIKKTQNNFFNRIVKNWNKIPTIEKGLKIKKFRDFLNGMDFTSEFLDV